MVASCHPEGGRYLALVQRSLQASEMVRAEERECLCHPGQGNLRGNIVGGQGRPEWSMGVTWERGQLPGPHTGDPRASFYLWETPQLCARGPSKMPA